MKRFVASFVVACIAMPLAAARVEIVLDVSGSMRAAAGNVSRMEAAQRAVRATVEAIDPGSNVALRLYGHRFPSEPKDASCRDTELVIPFGPLNRDRFIQAVQSAKPLGQTPLAYALEQAAADFGNVGDEPVAVILVSDGEESCGGDPARVACAFRERGVELTVHTVGFDVGDVARRQLQAIAHCTGGEYRDARNAGELADSLRQLTQAGLLIEKKREGRSGNVVRGGDGFTTAVPIAAGTYKLDHHQRGGEFDYFSIDLKPGQLIRVTQTAYETGVTIDGSTFTENAYPVAGAAIYAPDQSNIAEAADITAGKKVTVGASVSAGHGGKYFVLIGQKLWSNFGIHKESPFTIEVVDASDAGSGTDAGAKEAEAVPIRPGKFASWFQPGDGDDVYAFDALPGGTYGLMVRPDGKAYGLGLTVTDEDRVELAKAYAPNEGAAVRVEQVKPTRPGRLYVRVSQVATGDAVPYAMELTASGVAAASTLPGGDSAAATAKEAESSRGMLAGIPGGMLTLAAVAVVFIVMLGVIAVLLLMLMRKRKETP